ncbi:MAG TPA: hypothetical protein VI756_23890 [Blastocatellia bacterium]
MAKGKIVSEEVPATKKTGAAKKSASPKSSSTESASSTKNPDLKSAGEAGDSEAAVSKKKAAGPGKASNKTASAAKPSAEPAPPPPADSPKSTVSAPKGSETKAAPSEPAQSATQPASSPAASPEPEAPSAATASTPPAPAVSSRPAPDIPTPATPAEQPASASTAVDTTATAASEQPAAASTAAAPESNPPDELDGVQLPASRGTASIFGGPKDHSRKPDDKLGLPTGPHFQYERVRNLNPKAFYCSMRWEYRQGHLSAEEGKRWWANKKILVTNPANGASVVVKAIDYGPHENTGHAVGLSPAAADALGIEAGNEVEIRFADQKAQIGLAAVAGT